MAEMNIPQNGGKRKTAAPRIDLTPMVDLGFLLITFFMFTTTLAQSRKLEINMPSKEPTNEITAFPAESAITLIPSQNHMVAYYEGELGTQTQIKTCPIPGIRNVLQRKQKETAALPASYSKQAHLVHVLIKPKDDSKYADLVNILDEMLILKIEYYAIVDISPEEITMTTGKF